MRVTSPAAASLARALQGAGIAVDLKDAATLTTTEAPAARIGEIAAANGVVLHELTTIRASLEEAYLELTGHEVEYTTGPGSRPAPVPARQSA